MVLRHNFLSKLEQARRGSKPVRYFREDGKLPNLITAPSNRTFVIWNIKRMHQQTRGPKTQHLLALETFFGTTSLFAS